MLAVSSGYKNDLVSARHAASLTTFNFTARVGFITLLLCGCERGDKEPHLCTHVHLPTCASAFLRLQHLISIQWGSQLNRHTPLVPVLETEGLHFAVTNLTSDQMLQSRNHVCATEFFNLSMTPLNASGPITEPN